MGGLKPLSLWRTTAMLEAQFTQDIVDMERIEQEIERRSCTHGEQELVRETPRMIFRCVDCNALLPE